MSSEWALLKPPRNRYHEGTDPVPKSKNIQDVTRRRDMMHRWLLGVSVALSAAVVAPFAVSAWAQENVPQIPYDSVPNFLKMPKDMYLGEVSGVAVNSKGHVFVYSRRGNSNGP